MLTATGKDSLLMRKPNRRGVVITLALFSGIAGELVAAASMTRIAGPAEAVGGRLGFPVDLRWTLFAVVSIAGWVGAILWTSTRARDKRAGCRVNVVASALAGTAVGLDHLVHASPVLTWRAVAFCVGMAMPLFSTVMVHLIAGMVADQPGASRARGSRSSAPSPSADVARPDKPVSTAGHERAPATNGRVIRIDAHTHKNGGGKGDKSDPRLEFSRAWLAEHETPETAPQDLREAATDAGVSGITRQYASRQLRQHRERATASG